MKSITAENIKLILKKKCFKQSAIAVKAGYDIKVFNNMLNGRKLITDVDIAKIASVLEVEPNELFAKAEKDVS